MAPWKVAPLSGVAVSEAETSSVSVPSIRTKTPVAPSSPATFSALRFAVKKTREASAETAL